MEYFRQSVVLLLTIKSSRFSWKVALCASFCSSHFISEFGWENMGFPSNKKKMDRYIHQWKHILRPSLAFNKINNYSSVLCEKASSPPHWQGRQEKAGCKQYLPGQPGLQIQILYKLSQEFFSHDTKQKVSLRCLIKQTVLPYFL